MVSLFWSCRTSIPPEYLKNTAFQFPDFSLTRYMGWDPYTLLPNSLVSTTEGSSLPYNV